MRVSAQPGDLSDKTSRYNAYYDLPDKALCLGI